MIKVWMMAARPKTLTASLVPVAVGSALAFLHQQTMDWPILFYSFFCAVCVQIGTNLINDALDFKKGTDTEKRIGPVRVAQSRLLSPSEVMKGGGVFLTLGALFGIPLVLKGGIIISFLLALSLLLAYLYTGGPFPLSYRGLGEVFVFLFFGLIGTAGAFYIQTLKLSWPAIVAGIEIGFLATLLIAVNNVRDTHTDREAGKRTISVRFGINFGKRVITLSALAPFSLNVYWISESLAAALLPWLAFPLAMLIVVKVWKTAPSKAYNDILGMSALLHLSFGLLLTFGLLL